MLGKLRYSDFRLCSLRRGKVHRKAFANKLATCSWLNDIDLLVLCFSNGMADGMRSGSRNANRIISGSVSVKKAVDSASSNSLKYNYKSMKLKRTKFKSPKALHLQTIHAMREISIVWHIWYCMIESPSPNHDWSEWVATMHFV